MWQGWRLKTAKLFQNETFLAQNILNLRYYFFPSIVQGADWHWGPSATAVIKEGSSGQPSYIRTCALITCVLSFVFLIAYLVYQVGRVQVCRTCIRTTIHVHAVFVPHVELYHIAGSFGELFDLANFSNVTKFKITDLNLKHVCLWCWAFRSPNLSIINTKWVPFCQFNTHQTYPLYGISGTR